MFCLDLHRPGTPFAPISGIIGFMRTRNIERSNKNIKSRLDQVEVNGETKTHFGSHLSGTEDEEKAFCKLCKALVSFKVLAGGANDIRKHCQTADNHHRALALSNQTRSLGIILGSYLSCESLACSFWY